MSLEDFQLQLFRGNIFKELVKGLLEASGYLAIPYGYENIYWHLKNKINKKSSPTALRIRASPDLLVYDDKTDDVQLVEVKMSSYDTPKIKNIETYQKYWNDAMMVIVCPCENVFYTQAIAHLGVKDWYVPTSDFKRIQDVFERIHPTTLSEYQEVARKMINATTKRRQTPKTPSTIPPEPK